MEHSSVRALQKRARHKQQSYAKCYMYALMIYETIVRGMRGGLGNICLCYIKYSSLRL